MGKPNFKPNTLWIGDNLKVLRRMNSECVDLIYLDPPFNPNANYAAPIGSKAAIKEFKDTWTLSEIDVVWLNILDQNHKNLANVIRAAPDNSTKSYLCYMVIRLLEMHRVLKDTGSIYLHCDPTISHYLKLLMDGVFGRKNFHNEIIWGYEKPRSAKKIWRRNHDVILFYSKCNKYTFNPQRVPKLDGTFTFRKPFKRPDGSYWKPKEPGKQAGSWWYDIPSFATRITARERTKYQTQKPLALLERIIRASSNEGDLILDPFCGCATAFIAAYNCDRKCIGIDISPKAQQLIKFRYKNDLDKDWRGIIRKDIPKRTDLGKLPKPSTHKNKLYGICGGNCAGCENHYLKKDLEVDHIISEDAGGTDHFENLQLLCSNCNRIKGRRDMAYLKLVLLRLNAIG